MRHHVLETLPNERTDSRAGGIEGDVGRVAAILRAPLLQVLLLGLMIVASAHLLDGRAARYTIKLGPDQLNQVSAEFAEQYGAPPTPAQFRALVAARVRQEVFLREAYALGLDRDDEIVRRRLAQKAECLVQDQATPPSPTAADLRAWYAAHAADYTVPARRTFDQLCYAVDRRGDDATRALAGLAAARLARGGAAPAADAFPGSKVVRLLSARDTARLFGEQEFARAVFAAAPGRWTGPIRSGFGWHVVRVTEAAPPQRRSFAEARAEVVKDWTAAERAARDEQAYRRLLDRYTVTVADTAR